MLSDHEPSDELLLAEIDEFLVSTRADTARARRIARSLPISFAALCDAGIAPPPVILKGAKILTAIALLTPAAAALIVYASISHTRSSNISEPSLEQGSTLTLLSAPTTEGTATAPAAGWNLDPTVVDTPKTPYLSPPLTPPSELDIAAAASLPEDVPPHDGRPNHEEKPLWSLQSRTNPEPPAVASPEWTANAIDRFVLAKIESAGLSPAGDASPAALLRRLYYDLTGLPPTPEEVERFLRASNPGEAYVKTLDELLARWQYGEKWARHWLDLAGYDAGVKHAWRYREYVIAAFNHDKPFNWFLAEQIAGDQLYTGNPMRRAEAQVATGFLAMGAVDEAEEDAEKLRMDQIDGQIDLVTRTFLGLSVACARCHDHKFDPIPQRDYYALAGIFRSTVTRNGYNMTTRSKRSRLVTLDTSGFSSTINVTDRYQRDADISRLRSQSKSYLSRIRHAQYRGDSERVARLQASHRAVTTRLRKLENVDFGKLQHSGARAIGLAESQSPLDCQINIDGEVHKLGDHVPRGFLSSLSSGTPEIPIPAASSGRLELAKWLLAESHPLTARVYVNRIWAQLLGKGIVRSVDEFGTNGRQPTHPELLDYLAGKFIEGGWSTKRLVREIVLSRTYRLDSAAPRPLFEADPENRLFARHELRPLAAEQLRDSMIATAGVLTGASAAARQQMRYLASGEFGAVSSFTDGDSFPLSSPFRTIYLPIKTAAPGMLALFDCPEPGARTPQRPGTTTPTQALFMMNNEFAYQAAMEAAFRVTEKRHGQNAEGMIDDAFLSVIGRRPSKGEIGWAVSFLKEFSAKDDVSNPGFSQSADPLVSRALAIAGAEVPKKVAARQIQRVLPWTMLYHALMQTAEFRLVR